MKIPFEQNISPIVYQDHLFCQPTLQVSFPIHQSDDSGSKACKINSIDYMKKKKTVFHFIQINEVSILWLGNELLQF